MKREMQKTTVKITSIIEERLQLGTSALIRITRIPNKYIMIRREGAI